MRLPDAVGRRFLLPSKPPPKSTKINEYQIAYVDACYDMLIEYIETRADMDNNRQRELIGFANLMREVSIEESYEASLN